VFKFYLDDSKRPGVLAVGGYVAHTDQWTKFEEEWGFRLRQAGVEVFHATDFYNSRGEFEGWDKQKQREFAKYFTAIAEKQTELAIGRAVEVDAYDEHVAPILATSHWSPHGRITPLMWCARTCLEALAVRHARFVPSSEQIAVVFEEGDGIGETIDYMRGLQKRGAPFAQRFESFSDGPKSVKPLQAADLIAHEAIRAVQEKISPTGRSKRKSMLRLVQGQRVDLRVFTRRNLIDDVVPSVRDQVADFERP
jgi:hypothetical protein